MLRTCSEGCGQWAQWRVAVVRGQSEEDQQKDREKKLHPRGPEIEVIGYVCSAHKEALETAPKELNLRFSFVGAIAST